MQHRALHENPTSNWLNARRMQPVLTLLPCRQAHCICMLVDRRCVQSLALHSGCSLLPLLHLHAPNARASIQPAVGACQRGRRRVGALHWDEQSAAAAAMGKSRRACSPPGGTRYRHPSHPGLAARANVCSSSPIPTVQVIHTANARSLSKADPWRPRSPLCSCKVEWAAPGRRCASMLAAQRSHGWPCVAALQGSLA